MNHTDNNLQSIIKQLALPNPEDVSCHLTIRITNGKSVYTIIDHNPDNQYIIHCPQVEITVGDEFDNPELISDENYYCKTIPEMIQIIDFILTHTDVYQCNYDDDVLNSQNIIYNNEDPNLDSEYSALIAEYLN